MKSMDSKYNNYIWYILRYHEDFKGSLNDNQCMRKMLNEVEDVNMLDYAMVKRELRSLSEEDISLFIKYLEQYYL